MKRITGAIAALFLSAAIMQMIGAGAAMADGPNARDFARRNVGLGQPPHSVGTRPLLVIAARFGGADGESGWVDTFDRTSIARRFFASSSSSVNGYMRTASRGAFSYVPAAESNGVADDGIVEVSLDQPFNSYPTLWARANAAMIASDDQVNFASYDTNSNGQIEGTELTLEVISIGTGARDAGEADSIQRSGAFLNIDGISLAPNFWAAEVTPHTNFMTTVHELFHATFATIDEYGWGVGSLSVMGPTAGIADSARFLPSAVTRFQLGWLTPAVTTSDTSVALRPGDAMIVANPSAEASRYFMVEAREQAGLDANASGSGLVVWRVDNNVSDGGNGMTRGVELVTPNVLTSDRRIQPCMTSESSGCHSGDAGDVFGRGGIVPLRYQAGSGSYSAGGYAGMFLELAGSQVSVRFGDAPVVTAGRAVRATSNSVVGGARSATTAAPASVEATTSTTEVAKAAVGVTRALTDTIEAEKLLDMLCEPEVFDC